MRVPRPWESEYRSYIVRRKLRRNKMTAAQLENRIIELRKQIGELEQSPQVHTYLQCRDELAYLVRSLNSIKITSGGLTYTADGDYRALKYLEE